MKLESSSWFYWIFLFPFSCLQTGISVTEGLLVHTHLVHDLISTIPKPFCTWQPKQTYLRERTTLLTCSWSIVSFPICSSQFAKENINNKYGLIFLPLCKLWSVSGKSQVCNNKGVTIIPCQITIFTLPMFFHFISV